MGGEEKKDKRKEAKRGRDQIVAGRTRPKKVEVDPCPIHLAVRLVECNCKVRLCKKSDCLCFVNTLRMIFKKHQVGSYLF
jgi:hypothetical protein